MGIFSILLLGIINAISTIPSIVVTTIKFRTGVIPSLQDPYFKRYRVGLLATTFLLGGSIWGALISAFIIFTLAASLTFLTVYPVSRWKEICNVSSFMETQFSSTLYFVYV